ncbi:hypothetical protein B9Z65_5917 [Elsinoe australis]|uniref:Uncharacterized protein n=1 Tax=Elsinoe australis TaxID=40998 RepID=A0A2P7YJF2_9PEZI|nr:hypothetical protein B9Z65_5917 [Elsinoe australis]
MRQHDYNLVVDECDTQDLDKAISAQLRPQRLSGSIEIEQKIRDRASGVFQWVNLVTERLIEKDNEGEGPRAMLREIENTPDELKGIYEDLLQRTSRKDAGDALLLMQWICFSARPLTLDELRIALVMDARCIQKPTVAETLLENEGCTDTEHMEKKLKALSKGLLEVKSYGGPRLVHFIHQSALEYTIDEGLVQLYHKQREWIQPHEDVAISAHHRLVRSCIRYLVVHEICALDHEALSSTELRLLPFSEYVVDFWRWHATLADAMDICPQDLVEALRWPSPEVLQSWIDLSHTWASCRGTVAVDQFSTGNNLLFVAVEAGLTSVIEFILSRMTDPRTILRNMYHSGASLLDRAAVLGRCPILRLLLHHGMDAETPSEYGMTPLHWAAKSPFVEAVQMLLDAGADAQARDRIDEQTPLHEAAKSGHIEVMALLLTKATDADPHDKHGLSPLHFADWDDNSEIITRLIEAGADVNSLNKDKTQQGYLQIVSTLLSFGCDPNIRGRRGLTAVAHAAINDHIKVLRALIQANADLHLSDLLGNNVLLITAGFGSASALTLLLDEGANPDCTNNAGSNALHMTALYDTAANATVLLERGVGTEERDIEGWTPLMLAASHEQSEAVTLLMQWGAYEMSEAESIQVVMAQEAVEILEEDEDVGTEARFASDLERALSASLQVDVDPPTAGAESHDEGEKEQLVEDITNDLSKGDGIGMEGKTVPAESRAESFLVRAPEMWEKDSTAAEELSENLTETCTGDMLGDNENVAQLYSMSTKGRQVEEIDLPIEADSKDSLVEDETGLLAAGCAPEGLNGDRDAQQQEPVLPE